MTEKQHAFLSASSAERWLNCPPSARLAEHYPDSTSDYAAEGTCAHELGEYKVRSALGEDVADVRDNLDFYDAEMEEHTHNYVTYILELIGTAKEPRVLVEQRLDFSRWVPEGFGTADCVIIADGTLHVVDFKYGTGVLVVAEDNPQMKLYALGALDLFDGIYDIENVSMTVYQPRRENISTFTVSKDALYQWADEKLKPTADIAFKGEGEFRCGDWCGFCRAKSECRARADYNMELAKYAFADPVKLPDLLEDDEIESILSKIEGLTSWAKDIQDYAFKAACKGKQWSGFKLVRGTSRRKITDSDKAAEILRKNGHTEIYKSELLGITELGKAVGGAKKLNELLADLIVKPLGKPALVPESDKREPITVTTAEEAFSEPTLNEKNEME